MSSHLHGNFLTRCVPRKRRRTWGHMLMSLALLLALSVLAGWLWSLVKEAAI